MPLDVFGLSIPLPGDSGQPSAKDAQTQLDQAYEKARTELAQAQTDVDRQNAQSRLDQIQNAKETVAARWASVGVSQQNADTNARNADTNAQNASTNAGKAADTAGYHQRSLDLRSSADQALANYRNGVLSAKGDANKINMAKAEYQHQMAMINAQINQLKDEMVADTDLDKSADTSAVTQADSRNAEALKATDAAAGRVAAPDMIKYGAWAGNPTGAAGAMAGLMQAGSAYSNANGGAPVDVQNLALQHKMQIADLVLNKGVSFQDAKSTVLGGGGGGSPAPGYTAGNASASGAMGSQGFQPGAGNSAIRNPDGTIRTDVDI